MIRDSRQTVSLSIGFLVAPAIDLGAEPVAEFNTRLAAEGIQMEAPEQPEGALLLGRTEPSALQIQATTGTVTTPDPVAVTQLVIFSAATDGTFAASPEEFRDAAHEVTDIARDVWPEMDQVLAWNAGVKALYASAVGHSYQFLWEQRLGQPTDSFTPFGRPVAGGGLRIILAPGTEPAEQFQAEIRAESYLQDPRFLLVELDLASVGAAPISTMNPTTLVQVADAFFTQRVEPFLAGG